MMRLANSSADAVSRATCRRSPQRGKPCSRWTTRGPGRGGGHGPTFPHVSSIIDAQRLIVGWLSGWSCAPFIPVAATVATAFVENVLRHTDSAPTLRVEYDGRVVAIAVEDASTALAQRKEEPRDNASHISGLSMVTALTRVWGNLPTPTGKIVWAVVGPESVL